MTGPAHPIDDSQRTAAKVAAVASLLTFGLIVFANFGMRGRLLISGDMAATVRGVAAAEPLYRMSVVVDLVYCAGVVVLLTAMYVVLRPVSRHLALLATCWKLMYTVTAVLLALSLLTIGRLATNPAYAKALGSEPLQALVRLTLSGTWEQYYVGLVFWALSATVLGWLWLKSRYIPAALATFGLVASGWCAFCAMAYLSNPDFAQIVGLNWFDVPMVVFDMTLSIWLLVKGLSPAATKTPPAASVIVDDQSPSNPSTP